MRTPYLTPTETARVLGITSSGVRWLVDTRRLKAVRTPSGRRLIVARDLERLRRDRESVVTDPGSK